MCRKGNIVSQKLFPLQKMAEKLSGVSIHLNIRPLYRLFILVLKLEEVDLTVS